MARDKASSWLYFGYEKGELRRLVSYLAQENLQELQGYCAFLILFLAVMLVAKCQRGGWTAGNILPIMVVIVISLLLILLAHMNWPTRLSVVNRSRLLTFTLTVSVYLLAIFYEIFRPDTQVNVMLCLSFLAMNALFDGYPWETISMTAGTLLIVAVLEWFWGPEGYFLQNMLNCTIAAIVGCYLAWRRSREKVYLLIQQERENALRDRELRTQLMLSQIRPHFLYNVLATIQVLCDSEPEKAEEAIGWLCDVLRGNMDALGSSRMIPFQRELEHLQNYIHLEQLRFGEKLHVEYDLTATDFQIPSLTLQPIVENAVKHGVGNKRGGGTITIASREKQNIVVLTVSDDGAGVAAPTLDALPKKNDGRSHVGLHNVRERLQLIAGGSLSFYSTPGGGTIVTVYLPKEVAK